MPSTTRDLLAQSIFPRLDCDRFLSDETYQAERLDLVSTGSVGGFVLFSGTVDDGVNAIAVLRREGGDDLLFACDCEDGVSMRFASGTQFPSMMALGRANDPSTTYSVARCIAREMRQIGIGWNFAPVADLNTNPDNPIINIRSFGDSPDAALPHLEAYLMAMQDGGVAACLKHFPGHGDTSVDSHIALPASHASRKRLMSVELLPFIHGVRKGVLSVMSSHIVLPELDPSGLPASLSEKMLSGLLRIELQFSGIIVTDALDMHAITNGWSDADASVKAYLAGNDVLEVMPNPRTSLQALVRAADDGAIPKSRVRSAAKRISSLKKWTRSFDNAPGIASYGSHAGIALEAARRTVNSSGKTGPLQSPVLVVSVADRADNPKPAEWLAFFQGWFSGDVRHLVVCPDLTQEEVQNALQAVNAAGTVILALFVKPTGFAGSVGLHPVQRDVVLQALNTRGCVLMNFGNPYLLNQFHPALRIDTYSSCSASLAVSVEALSRSTG